MRPDGPCARSRLISMLSAYRPLTAAHSGGRRPFEPWSEAEPYRVNGRVATPTIRTRDRVDVSRRSRTTTTSCTSMTLAGRGRSRHEYLDALDAANEAGISVGARSGVVDVLMPRREHLAALEAAKADHLRKLEAHTEKHLGTLSDESARIIAEARAASESALSEVRTLGRRLGVDTRG